MANTDFAFANDVRAAVELRTPRTARMLLWSVLALFVAGATWAHFAVLDEVKRGNGRVVPSRQTQVVQSLEGGIVDEILVQEGVTAKVGAPLAVIRESGAAASPAGSCRNSLQQRQGGLGVDAAVIERAAGDRAFEDQAFGPAQALDVGHRERNHAGRGFGGFDEAHITIADCGSRIGESVETGDRIPETG